MAEDVRASPWRPMLPRSTDESHRTATWLELLFDLCFVVAVAQAASSLHHAVAGGHPVQAVVGYAMAFFAIWWAWMNVTWFASAYDTDDVPYRLAVFVEIAGALILAAGVPRAFETGDYGVVTLGYVTMRLALVFQWLRAARADQEGRPCALRYALGVSVVQAGWLLLLLAPLRWWPAGAAVLVAFELAVPVWAERAQQTSWHPGHIAERYGLFTLIVLGESVLAASFAVQTALDAGQVSAGVLLVAASGLVIVFAMWWLYFDQPAEELLTSQRRAFQWGYGHLLIFASAAAVGAGLAVEVDVVTAHSPLSAAGGAAAVGVPVAAYLLSVWVLHIRPHHRGRAQDLAFPATALLVLGAAALGALPLIALLLAGLTAVSVANRVSPSEAA
jgi:low temperature requirement protein LtrA